MNEFADDIAQHRSATHDINANAQQTAETAMVLHGIVGSLSALIRENEIMSTGVLENSTRLKSDADSLQRQVQDFTSVLVRGKAQTASTRRVA